MVLIQRKVMISMEILNDLLIMLGILFIIGAIVLSIVWNVPNMVAILRSSKGIKLSVRQTAKINKAHAPKVDSDTARNQDAFENAFNKTYNTTGNMEPESVELSPKEFTQGTINSAFEISEGSFSDNKGLESKTEILSSNTPTEDATAILLDQKLAALDRGDRGALEEPTEILNKSEDATEVLNIEDSTEDATELLDAETAMTVPLHESNSGDTDQNSYEAETELLVEASEAKTEVLDLEPQTEILEDDVTAILDDTGLEDATTKIDTFEEHVATELLKSNDD